MARKSPGKVAESKSDTIREIPRACADEDAAVEFLERKRWGDCPCCPHCWDTDVYQMTSRDGGREKNRRWRCRGCKKQYSVRTGTVFEDSRIPLRHWCFAFWAACASKKGVSAKQIQRQTGLSYKSALFLMHRIRWAMHDPTPPQLGGIVEADETWVGGKPRASERQKRGWTEDGKRIVSQRQKDWQKRKTPVMAAVQRGAGVRASVAQEVTAHSLKAFLTKSVQPGSTVMTDEHRGYIKTAPTIGPHKTVNHGRGEYARYEGGPTISTNTVEGFFAILKRGLNGVYHAVSPEHLHRYVAEFEFRYNRRHLDDGARTVAAIQGAVGKRLTYRDPSTRSA